MSLGQPPVEDWRPPQGFVQVQSALEGITVFAPRFAPPADDLPVTFKCPNCGATTRYDVAAGGVACEYCGYRAPVESAPIGRQAAQYEFTLETLARAEQGWGVARRELSCENCGAAIALPKGALTATCPFCGSNKVNLHSALADHLRPRYMIPFSVRPESIKPQAREWLGKGWFHPGQLATSAIVDQLEGVYLSFWTFDATVDARWKAQVGYPRQRRYYDQHDKTWKTRTEIEWRWEEGRVAFHVDDLLVSASSRASSIILERIYPFDLNELVEYKPEFLAGWLAQAYDVGLDQAWNHGKAAIREQARQACYADIPTSNIRNFSMAADFSNESWRYVLLPVYLTAYRFENKTYQVMVNGQTGVIAGQKPVAWWKIWLAVAALFTPGVVLALFSLPLLALGGAGVIPMMAALILLFLGGVTSVLIYRRAMYSEAV